jgi:predicted DNA-binding transcriptional regulator AlpA
MDTSLDEKLTAATPVRFTPVWIRIPSAVQVFGIGRSRIYELIRDQKIVSKCLKQRRDSKRGIRLVSWDSLLEYINNGGSE